MNLMQRRRGASVASSARTVIVASVAATIIVACGDSASSSGAAPDSGASTACTDDVPASCPPDAPTYAKDIASIVQASCATCHTPGGRESSRLLTDYAHVFAQRNAVLLQVNACRMPPRAAPPMSVEGRKALLTWLVCGAKND